MKKALTIGMFIMILTAAVMLSGCKNGNDNNTLIIPTNGGTKITTNGNTNTTSPLDNGLDIGDEITADQTKIDLKISELYWATITPEPGDSVGLTIIVTNIGFEPAEGFDYTVKVTDESNIVLKEETFTTDEIIGRGNTTKFKPEFTLPQGVYTAIVQLDSSKKIKELNELNNVMSTLIPAKSGIVVQPRLNTSDDTNNDTSDD